eukprot:1633109-Karenia_brevis.AAC.1
MDSHPFCIQKILWNREELAFIRQHCDCFQIICQCRQRSRSRVCANHAAPAPPLGARLPPVSKMSKWTHIDTQILST